MKEVNMYVRGSRNIEREGTYKVILEYKGYRKLIEGKDINTTSNRMLIIGVIKGIEALKEPCKIKVYSHTYVGFGKMKSKKGKEIIGVRNSVNKDLLLILKQTIKDGGHIVEEKLLKNHKEIFNSLLNTL
ncbi:ribonuclease HI [Clostridium acetireducens DSM 10703]|uniref:Ribonuclease HI n=1 Tax=Clostridium acetireducens DSM 10703 TaxID=1121290 RepID=A0A1E8EWG5_9CLOT|nr:RNase H family protein [Clostridium acetireducens]OFI04962.1 ribonuclease HI [Clostridium acetireducens DSM 10703]